AEGIHPWPESFTEHVKGECGIVAVEEPIEAGGGEQPGRSPVAVGLLDTLLDVSDGPVVDERERPRPEGTQHAGSGHAGVAVGVGPGLEVEGLAGDAVGEPQRREGFMREWVLAEG